MRLIAADRNAGQRRTGGLSSPVRRVLASRIRSGPVPLRPTDRDPTNPGRKVAGMTAEAPTATHPTGGSTGIAPLERL